MSYLFWSNPQNPSNTYTLYICHIQHWVSTFGFNCRHQRCVQSCYFFLILHLFSQHHKFTEKKITLLKQILFCCAQLIYNEVCFWEFIQFFHHWNTIEMWNFELNMNWNMNRNTLKYISTKIYTIDSLLFP